ncbi:hypothetical protein D3C72_1109570 [compost metagenome]
MAERLLQYHPAALAGQPDARQLRADGGEQVRRGRQVAHHHRSGTGVDQFGERLEAGIGVGIDLQVHDALQEALPRRGIAGQRGQQRVVQHGHVGVVRQRLAAQRQDAPARVQRAGGVRIEQRRQQLAPRQVAGGAEQYEIKFRGVGRGGQTVRHVR